MPKRISPPWSENEQMILSQRYQHIPAKAIALVLGRPIEQVYQMAHRLGLAKSDEFFAGELSGRLNGTQGRNTQFVKGQKPWNHGMKGFQAGGRARETQFKKGNKPHTWLPIGSERINDGYLQRKMTDTGYTPRDWVEVHRLLWIEHHGEIPAGHVIAFKDALPKHENITIDRLECISRAELASRNTIHRYPPEVKQVIRLQRKLERKVKERADEK
ncbi:MAG: HNH endonuclease signature motif containing protein [Pseudomonadaceae bacterium]